MLDNMINKISGRILYRQLLKHDTDSKFSMYGDK